MTSIVDLLIPGFRSAREYAADLLKDIPDDIYARKFEVNGNPLEACHPAFQVGHLATYPTKILTVLGQGTAPVAHPKEWDALFIKGTPCHDDPEGTIYPARAKIEKQFFDGHDTLIELLPTIPDEAFYKENPFEASRARFALAGQFATYLLSAHILGHLGQISMWRRAAGLASVY